VPDLVLVWNDVQSRKPSDARRLARSGRRHGAHPYDQWFGRAPFAQPRELLLARRAARRIVRSSLPLFVAVPWDRERAGVRREMVEAIRTSGDPRLQDIGILIRPHPARPDEWKQIDSRASGTSRSGRAPGR